MHSSTIHFINVHLYCAAGCFFFRDIIKLTFIYEYRQTAQEGMNV